MKRIVIIVAVVIAVVAILIAAVPFVVPSEFLKVRVADRISALTGRQVTFSGEPSLSIYPHVTIAIGGLSVANPEDMGTDPVITAETVRARLRFLPMLVGRAVFDEFELVRPTIHLVSDDQGRRNWRIAGGAIAREAQQQEPPKDAPKPLLPIDVQIGHVIVTDGTLLYDDLASDKREELTDFDFDMTWPSVSAAASGLGKFNWRGEPVEFNAVLAAPLDVMRGKESAARFAIASTPLRASFSGRASLAEGPHIEGNAGISTPSMRRTIEWLGTPMGTGAILGAGSINGTVATDGLSVRFSDSTLELDGNTATGSLGVDLGRARPAIDGNLSAVQLDLSAYMEAARADVLANGSWLIAPAKLDFADAIDADIKLALGQVTIGGVQAGKTAAAVAIHNGAFDLTIDQAQFYSGSVKTSLHIGPQSDTLAATLDAEVNDVTTAAALTALAGISAVHGEATGKFALKTSGRNWAEFAHSVTGSGNININGGEVDGLDFATVAEAMSDPFAGPMTTLGGSTFFQRLSAGLTVSGGEIATDDLYVEGGDFRLSLNGHGSVLSGAVDARATLTTGSESIPLTVAGTWRQPAIARVPFKR